MDETPWLVTWTTYGSWLPGDPRGFRTFRGMEYVPPPARYAKDGEPIYDPKDYSDRYARAKEFVPVSVRLNSEEQKIVCQAFVEELALLQIPADILAVGFVHMHLIARFGHHWIRPTAGRLKSAATRAIPNPSNRKRIWTRNCHMESLPNQEDLHQATIYVRRHRDEGALIWNSQAARPWGAAQLISIKNR